MPTQYLNMMSCKIKYLVTKDYICSIRVKCIYTYVYIFIYVSIHTLHPVKYVLYSFTDTSKK